MMSGCWTNYKTSSTASAESLKSETNPDVCPAWNCHFVVFFLVHLLPSFCINCEQLATFSQGSNHSSTCFGNLPVCRTHPASVGVDCSDTRAYCAVICFIRATRHG